MIIENKKVGFSIFSRGKKRYEVAGGYIVKGENCYSIEVQGKWYDIVLDIAPVTKEEGA